MIRVTSKEKLMFQSFCADLRWDWTSPSTKSSAAICVEKLRLLGGLRHHIL